MSAKRIAIRYATPLLELAIDQKVEDKVRADMQAFVKLCQGNRDFMLMLESPVIPHLRKAGILRKVFEGKVSDLTMKFFDVVVRKNRENMLLHAAQEFQTLYNQSKGLQEATVSTVVPLDAKTKAEFESLVKELTGKKPLLSEEVKEDLIGGFKLEIGDRKLDASVSGQLRALKYEFSKENK